LPERLAEILKEAAEAYFKPFIEFSAGSSEKPQ
jgi:hypothetical protein